LALDLGKFERNCARMIEKCRSVGVGLRPHMKTLKAIEAARVAVDPAHGGIAVSTLREAEYFAREGIGDIQYAVCITPDKLPRAAELMRLAPRFSFFLDSIDTAKAVAAFARTQGVPLRPWIEIDSGDGRTGLEPLDPRLLEIAAILADSPAEPAGVATHGGHSYGVRDAAGIADIADQERLAVVEAAERLRSAGFEVPGVSAGSTPTAVHMRSAEGLTEIRAGVYMTGDLFQVGIGSQGLDDIAAFRRRHGDQPQARAEPDRRRCGRARSVEGPIDLGASRAGHGLRPRRRSGRPAGLRTAHARGRPPGAWRDTGRRAPPLRPVADRGAHPNPPQPRLHDDRGT
jgi:D-serine deaminase-like pyridoxal phosphate-dependent protein